MNVDAGDIVRYRGGDSLYLVVKKDDSAQEYPDPYHIVWLKSSEDKWSGRMSSDGGAKEKLLVGDGFIKVGHIDDFVDILREEYLNE
jgi:hypothetical protein